MDILAGLLELSGLWVLGNKSRWGFILNISGNLLWIVIGVKTGLYGLLLVCVPALVINARNFVRWQGGWLVCPDVRGLERSSERCGGLWDMLGTTHSADHSTTKQAGDEYE